MHNFGRGSLCVLSIALLFAGWALTGCDSVSKSPSADSGASGHESAALITMDNETFGNYVKPDGGVVLVDFWASWCGPCLQLAPVISSIADEKQGIISVGKVDTDKNKGLSQKYSIQFLPTVILFKDGKEVERFIGVQGKNEYLTAISKATGI